MSDWVAIGISVIALIVSIFTWYKSNKKNNAQIEIEVKKLIDEKKKAVVELEQDKNKIIDYMIEEELNAYDKACALYIDKKVDKKRFKKDYYYEINNLFDNNIIIEVGKLNNENCKYNSLKKVYKDWQVK